MAAPREPVKPAAKSKKAVGSTRTPARTRGAKPVVKAAPTKKKRPPAPLPKGRRVAQRAGKLVGASLAAHRVPQLPDLPGFSGGLVGWFGFECIGYIEPRLAADAGGPGNIR